MADANQKKATATPLDAVGAAAARMVQNGDRVGLGSGRAAQAFVRMLGRRTTEEGLKIIGVPTSLLTEKIARESGVAVATLEEVEQLDIAVDGADEVDPNLNLLKGGGGNLLREKVIASIAKKFVIVVGEEKILPRLGVTFPVFVEVVEFARPVVTRKLIAMGAHRVEPRLADGKIFLTDNGNPLLHAFFGADELSQPETLDRQLHQVPGVVETGLFVGMADEVIIGFNDGRIERKQPKRN